jgi:hypothetical protein
MLTAAICLNIDTVAMTEAMAAPPTGLFLAADPELDACLQVATDVLGQKPSYADPPHPELDSFVTNVLSPDALRRLSLPNPAFTTDDALVGSRQMMIESRQYVFPRAYHVQAARVLYAQGLAKFKTSLAANGRLERAKFLLESSRSLLAPFVALEPTYRLNSQGPIAVGDWERTATVDTRRQYIAIKSAFARTLSVSGRIALAQDDLPNWDLLEEAHGYFRASDDKVGQVRNAFYLLMAEQNRGGLHADVDRQIGRIGISLASAIAQRQGLGAWRVASALKGHVLTPAKAAAALTDVRAV